MSNSNNSRPAGTLQAEPSGTHTTAGVHAPDSYMLLGSRVHVVGIGGAIELIEHWIAQRDRCRYVSVSNVNNVVEGLKQSSFLEVTNDADLSVPDGMPLVWVGRMRGLPMSERVAGPDLFIEFLEHTHEKGYRHFFYGGAEGVSEELTSILCHRFSGLKVVGGYSPPFRPLTAAEDAAVVDLISAAAPDVLWVGLGCPKQERWMFEHRDRLQVPVMLGVGQVFDLYSGRIRRAPTWMRRYGLEWLYRLGSNPGRLWRRYLISNTIFVSSLLLESAGLKKF